MNKFTVKIYWHNRPTTIIENANDEQVKFIVDNYCYKNASSLGVVVHNEEDIWYHINKEGRCYEC